MAAARTDPLQSDGDKLANALQSVGVDVTHELHPGVTHEFFGMGAAVASAKDAEEFASARLKASLKK